MKGILWSMSARKRLQPEHNTPPHKNTDKLNEDNSKAEVRRNFTAIDALKMQRI